MKSVSRLSAGLMALSAVFCVVSVAAAPPVYETREDHDPNGIGKFYMGREIARVMGHQGIPWLERSDREEEERISKLVEVLASNRETRSPTSEPGRA